MELLKEFHLVYNFVQHRKGACFMNNFIFENSTKVIFGKGCVKEYAVCWGTTAIR